MFKPSLFAHFVTLGFAFTIPAQAETYFPLQDLPTEVLVGNVLPFLKSQDLRQVKEVSIDMRDAANATLGEDSRHVTVIGNKDRWGHEEKHRVARWIPKTLQKKVSRWFLVPGSEPAKQIHALKRLITQSKYVSFKWFDYEMSQLLVDQEIRLDHVKELSIEARNDPDTHLAIQNLTTLLNPTNPPRIHLNLEWFTKTYDRAHLEKLGRTIKSEEMSDKRKLQWLQEPKNRVTREKIRTIHEVLVPFVSQIQTLHIAAPRNVPIFDFISDLTQLKKLYFTCEYRASKEDWDRLTHLKNLNSLWIDAMSHTVTLPALSGFPELNHLEIRRATMSRDFFGRTFTGHDALRFLHLENFQTDRDTLVRLENFPNLETLKLINTGIFDDQLEKLSQLSQLKHLDLSDNVIFGEGLEKFLNHKNLQVLKVSRKELIRANRFYHLSLPFLEWVD